MMHTAKYSGSIMLLALVFGAIFFIVLSGLSGYVLSENKFETFNRAQSEASSIAEAGLEYYRWHLAHFPTDLQNGTGHSGPYTVTYKDPQGGTVGTYTLNITGNQSCGQTTSIDITSTGRPANDPSVSQTLVASYARPTVAKYDFISNAGVWIGSNDVIHGPYRSNNGIRMDGTTNAPVTSARSTWTCTYSYGCNPSKTEPGVFGNGNNKNLWSYPASQIDFAGIAASFSNLKTIAQTDGIYLPRYSSGNIRSKAYHKGYHLVFNGNGTVSIYKVTARRIRNVQLLDGNTVGNDYSYIRNQTLYKTLTIPSSCGLIFVEDNTWVDGVIPSQVTLVVANTSNQSIKPTAFLDNNIVYGSGSGIKGFTLIAQRDILITANSPYNLKLYGVYVAQSGAFGRNYYGQTTRQGYTYNYYGPLGTLTTVGTVVSALQSAATWVGENNQFIGGYKVDVDYPDQKLSQNPPPFTPVLSNNYQFVNWRQK